MTQSEFNQANKDKLDALTENAVQQAIFTIQQGLGEHFGDFAGAYFSDDATGLRVIKEHLLAYAVAQDRYLDNMSIERAEDEAKEAKGNYVSQFVDYIIGKAITVNGEKHDLEYNYCGAIYAVFDTDIVFLTPLWDADFDKPEEHNIFVQLIDDEGSNACRDISFPLSFSDMDADWLLYKSVIENQLPEIISQARCEIKNHRDQYNKQRKLTLALFCGKSCTF